MNWPQNLDVLLIYSAPQLQVCLINLAYFYTEISKLLRGERSAVVSPMET